MISESHYIDSIIDCWPISFPAAENETWLPVPGTIDCFVSDAGSVIVNNGLVCPSINRNGYLVFRAKKSIGDYFLMNTHTAVALAFHPNPNNLPCINHKDTDRLNNAAYNLEWCSYAHNVHHAIDMGLMKGTARIVPDQFKELHSKMIGKMSLVARELNTHVAFVQRILTGQIADTPRSNEIIEYCKNLVSKIEKTAA